MADEPRAPRGPSPRGAPAQPGGAEPEILILSAGYGAGHNQAAVAVAEALRLLSPGTTVRVLDYLRFFPAGLAPATLGIYRGLTKWAPTAYGGLYRLTSAMARVRPWQVVEYSVGRRRLAEALVTRPPAAILCTHPLPMGVLGEIRRHAALPVPLAGLMTDFVSHDEWVKPFLDRYYVPTEAMAAALASAGVPAGHLVVTGIPVRRGFWTPPPPPTARRLLGFAPDVPVVLFLTSALGTLGRVPAAVRALLALPLRFRLVVIAGRDRGLYGRLAAWGIDPGRLTVLGFEERVAQLMAAADVVVTKGGAITLSEALALGRPIIVWRPVPGQEAGNARWIAGRGAGRIAPDAPALARTVAELLTRDDLRESLAAGARALGRPRAALAVAEDLLALARLPRRRDTGGRNPAN